MKKILTFITCLLSICIQAQFHYPNDLQCGQESLFIDWDCDWDGQTEMYFSTPPGVSLVGSPIQPVTGGLVEYVFDVVPGSNSGAFLGFELIVTQVTSNNGGCSVNVDDVYAEGVGIDCPCPAEASINLGQHETCAGYSDGEATCIVTNGSGNYSYEWSDPNSQTTSTAVALAPGYYQVTATDNIENCTDVIGITINSGPTPVTWYADSDNDGYGDAGSTTQACTMPTNFVADNTDCDDTNGNVFPGATEICNGFDDNCDDQIDEGLINTYYADTDNDGYGDPGNSIQACSAPSGYVSDDTDCDDTDGNVFPGATETCNYIDDNCDGQIDEGLQNTYYSDLDDDGYGDPLGATQACAPSPLFVLDNTDCDDTDPNIFPGAPEICNGIDDNCDGQIDEGLLITYYADTDNDGFGDSANSILSCSAPSGFVTSNTDCDDTNNAIFPGAVEICNGLDDNCDGTAEDIATCSCPSGFQTNTCIGTSEFWLDPTNWSLGSIPTICDDVIVPPNINLKLLNGELGECHTIEVATSATFDVQSGAELNVLIY